MEKLIENVGKINRSRLVIRHGLDFEMANIIPHCLNEDDGSGVKRILDAFMTYKQNNNSMKKLKHTIAAVAKIAPVSYLNAASPLDKPDTGFGFGHYCYPHNELPKISPEILIEWCSINNTRWTKVIPYIKIFVSDHAKNENDNKKTLSPLIYSILEIAPKPGILVEAIIQHINNTDNENGLSRDTRQKLEILKKQLKNHQCKEIRIEISNNVILKK